MCSIVCMKITTKILQFLNFSYEFHLLYQKYVIRNCQCDQKMSPLPFKLFDNSICMPNSVCESFSKKKLQYYQISYIILNLSSIFQMKIFSSIINRSHFLFQMNFNHICMAIIVFEGFFQKKSSILYIILCYPQFYHTYVS